MATIVLGAVGAAAGAAVGGGVLGLSSVVIGRAIGATIGRALDQRILGAGSEAVETGRVDRFRLTGAGEGAGLGRIHGRMRVAGQVIWASNFREHVRSSGGGKGAPKPKVKEFSYSVSMAVALCEGVISGIGRIWADGQEIEPGSLTLRVYPGDELQLPDPVVEAVEGVGEAPAYRGTAYVVIEEMDLSAFGSRVPQLSFEVFRPQEAGIPDVPDDPALGLRGVALIPATGEYAYATEPVGFDLGAGTREVRNVSTPRGVADLKASLDGLACELPGVGAVSLVVSWFGDDLRAGSCRVEPRVEQKAQDGDGMPWAVSGIGRGAAVQVPLEDGSPVYGGTPCDASILQALAEMSARGLEVMFYPFLLMCQQAGNGLEDPWTGAEDQPVLPWRGRITTAIAAGRAGTSDGTAAAEAEVAAFFGTAAPGDFSPAGGTVAYHGPEEASYRRFILHYAHLCAMAGGVESFCIGSELRGLTQIRGAGGSYPAVDALRALAADVRQVLGPDVKLSYAADWSEYFGHHPQDGSGDVAFHLDPLWADDEIDFVGIDNYMPLSDWRGGPDHADAAAGSVHDLGYLAGNIEGGEGFDWYYHSAGAREVQLRTPIADTAHGEDWVFRNKDIRGWWSNRHFNRPGGVRAEAPTAWVPGMKPIRFTEFGCPAVDKGANQPNVFVDPKSSESMLPYHSDGRRDDVVQQQYFRAHLAHWTAPGRNPLSDVYGGPMLDLDHAYAWCWDARPFPAFPNRGDLWTDAENYRRGHWLCGRGGAPSLATVVAGTCRAAGVDEVDVSQLYGLVRGYSADGTQPARAILQPLMLAHGFDAIEREGRLIFRTRGVARPEVLEPGRMLVGEDGDLVRVRSAEAEVSGRVRLGYVAADGGYEAKGAEAVLADEVSHRADRTEIALALTGAEAQGVVERWLTEARVARESARFALPPSRLDLGVGDVVEVEGTAYRLDRAELTEGLALEAVRIEEGAYRGADGAEEAPVSAPFVPPAPVYPVFLDLPFVQGSRARLAPHLAVAARPWPGSVALWESDTGEDFRPNLVVERTATLGLTETAFGAGPVGRMDRARRLRVRLTQGALSSATPLSLLNGANAAAIGDGSAEGWEIVQFQSAELVAPMTWELSMFLRGQAGSEVEMAAERPPGSIFVLLDPAVRQIEFDPEARGLPRSYRIGPAGRPFDDPTFVARELAFRGIGLRPYAPVHLRERRLGGDRVYGWIRRTRIDGDSWAQAEVPLGEPEERYRVQVVRDGAVLREVDVGAAGWTYGAAEQAADGAAGAAEVRVAQVSPAFGAGPEARLEVAF